MRLDFRMRFIFLRFLSAAQVAAHLSTGDPNNNIRSARREQNMCGTGAVVFLFYTCFGLNCVFVKIVVVNLNKNLFHYSIK